MKKAKDKITHWFLHHLNLKKFSDDTTIHGFKELYYSPSMVGKTFWTVIMISAVSVTVYQVIKSIQQYKDQPTVTTIQPLEEDKLMYPPFSICYNH